MKRIGAKGSTVAGIDVSHYDAVINWQKVKEQNIQFAIAKCTEYNIDNTFVRNRQGCKGQGILFGAYHFFHPGKDPKAQAELFLRLAAPEKGDLIPMLDWEVTDGMPAKTDVQRAQIWLDIVEKAVGRPPMIYTGPYFADVLKLPASFKKYPLFVAHYATMTPLVPAPWDTWTFHQYTDKGNLAGFQAGVHEDLDRFNGTIDELKKLVL